MIVIAEFVVRTEFKPAVVNLLVAWESGYCAEKSGERDFLLNAEADETSDNTVSRLCRFRRLIVRVLTPASVVAWIVGTLLWLTVRDGIPILSAIFYALPLPVLIIFGTVACATSLHQRRDCRISAACLLVVEMQIIVWGSHSFRCPVEPPPAEVHRFIFWNVCRGTFGYDAVARTLAESGADIIALVEATEEAEDPDFWASRIPGYSAHRLGSGMMILCRGRILRVRPGNVTVPEEPEALCRYRIISLEIDSTPMRVLLVDVKSNPLMSRKPVFFRLGELVESLSDQPLIVSADFNTPIDSVWVDQLRSRLVNSFEAVGEGYRETWPTLFPVLCLDQVWGNDRLTWHRSRQGWSIRSDHRSITAEFSIPGFTAETNR